MMGGDPLEEKVRREGQRLRHKHHATPTERAVEGITMLAKDRKQNSFEVSLFAVGDEKLITESLAWHGALDLLEDFVTIHHAHTHYEMDGTLVGEGGKRDTSLYHCMQLHKEGKCNAVFSAGNTQNVVIIASGMLGRLSNVIRRPPLFIFLPTKNGQQYALLDAGSNNQVDAKGLYDFAMMATLYYKHVLGKNDYSLGLLSNGEERGKGTEITRRTAELILANPELSPHFKGNVEATHIYDGCVDIVVCDGFTGNIYLKACEQSASTVGEWIKQGIESESLLSRIRHKTGYLLLKPVFDEIKYRVNPSQYGGAPLLGINGVVVVGHGRSDGEAFYRGVKVAEQFILADVNKRIKDHLI